MWPSGTSFPWRSMRSKRCARSPTGARTCRAISRLPALYRATCHHLALATDRHTRTSSFRACTPLVERAHQALYQSKSRWWANAWRFLSLEFPAALLRDNKGMMGLSALLFCVPHCCAVDCLLAFAGNGLFGVQSGAVADFEEMYRPTARHVGRPRGADTDFAMFGHHISQQRRH